MMDKGVKIINLGCKLNQFEGLSILQKLISYGFYEAKNGETNPDIYIVNTCTVTRKSDRKSRHAIYSAIKKKKSGAIVIVTGCMAQTDRDELSKIEGVDFIVGNDIKASLPDIIKSWYTGDKDRSNSELILNSAGWGFTEDCRTPFDFAVPLTSEKSRAFLKIQDGCDMKCTYCKVPLARGSSISRPVGDSIDAFKKLLDSGYCEVVLTGVNLGAYRYKNIKLSGLIESLLKIQGRYRIRLSSIEPIFIEDDLIDVIVDERICPHFHIPLQSGSDKILKKMNRGYSSAQFIRIIEKIKKVKPDVHLATDVIVGFPDETEEDFLKTADLLDSSGFASLHVFKYSPRKGTASEKLKETVTELEKRKRSEYLIRKSEEHNYKFRKRYTGTKRIAIIENHRSGSVALTDNYIKVLVDKKRNVSSELYGKLTYVYIRSVDPFETRGEIIKQIAVA